MSSARRFRSSAACSPSRRSTLGGIDLLDARGILRLAQLALQLLHLRQLVHELHGLAERERIVALEVVATAHLVERHELIEVHRQLRERRVEPLVLGEERLHHLLELAALPGREALHQRLHLGHLLAHLLEELIQALDAGEALSPLVLERLEVGLVALGAVAQHAVEVLDHLAHALHVLRAHVRQRVLHALHERLEHLLAQRLEQLLEHAPRLGIHELVILELADATGGIGRQLVQLRLALRGHLGELPPAVLGDLAALRPLARVVPALLDALPAPSSGSRRPSS